MAITGWGNFRPLPRIRQDGPMADHPHTIDRWDDATGENLIEQIAAVSDYLVALATYRAAVERSRAMAASASSTNVVIPGRWAKGCKSAR